MACFHTADTTCAECWKPANQSATIYHSPSVLDLEPRIAALEVEFAKLDARLVEQLAIARQMAATIDADVARVAKAAETRERNNHNYWRRVIATELWPNVLAAYRHPDMAVRVVEQAECLLTALEAREKETKP
jgi:hypothetical protein